MFCKSQSVHINIELCLFNREDGRDSVKFYTDPGYFFELWFQDIQKDIETKKTELKARKKKVSTKLISDLVGGSQGVQTSPPPPPHKIQISLNLHCKITKNLHFKITENMPWNPPPTPPEKFSGGVHETCIIPDLSINRKVGGGIDHTKCCCCLT